MLVTEITAQSIDEALRKQLAALEVSVDSREVGTVIQVGDGIARVDGLRNAIHEVEKNYETMARRVADINWNGRVEAQLKAYTSLLD